MPGPVYKIVELVGTSEVSVSEAVQNAVRRASQTLQNLDWFEVGETRGSIKDGRVSEFQVVVRIGYRLGAGEELRALNPSHPDDGVGVRATAEFDVTAIGNAIVDVIAQAGDDLISAEGLTKGTMALIGAEAAERIYGAMGPARESSGGSGANTVAGVAGLGGQAAFIGKVADDQLGAVFRHDIRAAGVTFDTPPLVAGLSTARCLILVTPDAERTMQTFLGAAAELYPEDVDAVLIGASRVVYLEGYLWDQPSARDAFRKAATLAAAAGRKVALTLSDPFCVERHRADFRDLISGHVDILFANEDEIRSLFEVETFEAAAELVRGHCEIAALTRSEKGSVVIAGSEAVSVPAHRVAKVVDTTGAGDAYAAGFLYAYTRGRDLAACARLGGLLAAEVIGHFGARAEADLVALAASI